MGRKKRHRKIEPSSTSEAPPPLELTKVPLGYVSLDKDGLVLDVNPKWYEIIGFSRDEVRGRWFGDFVAPESQPAFRKRFLELSNQGRAASVALSMVRKDERLVRVLFSGSIERGRAGQISRIHSFLQDATGVLTSRKAPGWSRKDLFELFDLIGDGVVMYEVRSGGEDFLIVDCNRASEKVDQIRREDVLGKSVLEVFPGVKEFGLFEVFQRVWRTGNPETPPEAFYRDERISGWRENYVYKLPTGEIAAISKDITERKRAEEEIVRVARFPAENPSPVLRIAIDGTLLYGNKASEPLQRTWECEVGGPVLSDVRELVQDALQEGIKTDEVEVGDRFLLLTFNPVTADGYVNVYSVDITERKLAEAALRKSAAEYRLLVENASEAIFIMQDGCIRFSNRATARLLESTTEDIVDLPLAELSHIEDRGMVLERYDRQLAGEQVESGFPFRLLTRKGNMRWGRLSAVRVEWQGRPAILSLVSDVTDRVDTLERLKRSQDSTIRAMAAITEMRDPYTAGHQERVAVVSCAIASEMGLAKDRIDGLRVAALLHDVGKMSVPAEILSSPAKLTEAQFSLVKEHPQTAYELLKGIEFPWPIADIVLQHHEHLDGSGYPNGLCADEISLEARILAVADVVEAMASHRPYRPSLGIDAALAEIAAHAGTHFDPPVVDACLVLFKDQGFALDDSHAF